MNDQDRKPVGMAFWLGTVGFGGLIWAGFGILIEDFVIAAFAALVFCWVGGMLTQVVVDLLRGRRLKHFQRKIWRWALALLVYYILAGILIYWIEGHINEHWRFLPEIVILLLPLSRLMPHLQAENARQRMKIDKSANKVPEPTSATKASEVQH